ncbi:uncharacterized protein ARMOST_05380 [Armillaria ostoyae]|uniref:Uncharacterized protein n=1 Tax=Armillaria ostoyae TaxID=47428 RepID=A0A284R001_ARMOS|nr:uncharacterized protein ARMOST_05380 [Armillaria ostoyae]
MMIKRELQWNMLLSMLPCLLSAPTSITDDHSLSIPSTTTPSSSTVGTLSPLPLYTWRPSPTRSPSSTNGSDNHQRPIAMFLEILGGIIALAIVLSLLRCIISYKRTPRRDRIAAIIHRHQLYREMDDLEYRMSPSFISKRSSLKEPPPPPYFPRPPAYDLQVTPPPSPVRSEFVQVDIACPLPSPTVTSQRGTQPILRNI